MDKVNHLKQLNAKNQWSVGSFFRTFGIHIGLAAMVIVTAMMSDVFLRPSNLINILRQVSINGILAVGMTMIIISGGIDLSVGSVIGVVGYVVAATLQYGLIPALLLGLAVGGLFGLINGFLVTKLAIPPFVATLGTMVAGRSVVVVMTGGYPMIPVENAVFKWIGAGYIGSIPVPIIICALAFAVFIWIMHKTKFGRYIYAIGSNAEASSYSGVKVDRIRLKVYATSGVLFAISGIVLTSRLYSTGPLSGQGYETDAIAAAVIGGTSMMGGEGKLSRTVIGVLILGVLSNLFNLLGVAADYQGIFKGLIIVIAVGLDTYSKKKKS